MLLLSLALTGVVLGQAATGWFWVKTNSKNQSGPKLCPEEFPFAYYGGKFCCFTNKEKSDKDNDPLCTGGALEFDSSCCQYDHFTSCTENDAPAICATNTLAGAKRQQEGFIDSCKFFEMRLKMPVLQRDCRPLELGFTSLSIFSSRQWPLFRQSEAVSTTHTILPDIY